jgi:cysteine desulfurase
MGVPPDLARGAIRVSLGASNTAQEVQAFLAALTSTVAQLKNMTAIAA